MRYYSKYDAIDLSWQWFLGHAYLHSVQWGTQFVWTYGPLGFLDIPLPFANKEIVITTLVINIIFRILFPFVVAKETINKNAKEMNTQDIIAVFYIVVATFVSMSRLPLSMLLALLGIVLLIRVFDSNKESKKIVYSATGGLILSLASSIKLNILPLSIVVAVLLAVLVGFTFKNLKVNVITTSVFIFSYAFGFLTFWILSKQSIGHLPIFFARTYWIIKGYTPAMFDYGNPWTEIGAVGLLIGFIYLIVIQKDKKQQSKLILLFFIAFLAFKEGFVRNVKIVWQNHILTFYALMIVIPLLIYGIIKEHKKLLIGLSVVNFLFIIYTKYENKKYVERTKVFHIKSTNPITILHKFYELPRSIVERTKQAPTTILPWDLLMAKAYGLNLQTLPVPQIYQAYTSKLDKLDANALETSNIKYIIYTYEDLDHRYPLYSAPDTTKVILNCYTLDIAGNLFSLLKKERTCRNTSISSKIDVKAKFGQWIPIPQHTSFANIYIYKTFLNSIVNLLYKPTSPFYIFFKLDNGKVYKYRVVPSVIKNGIYIKYFVDNQKDFNDLLSNNTNTLHTIKAIKIDTKNINLNYRRTYKITFY